jgi:ComF family protein
MSSIDRAWVACNYQGHIRSVIHNIKYKSKMGLIDFAARICGNFAKRFIDLDSVDYITYVPIDRIRKSQRSFNQSELLARTLAKDLEIQLLDKTIIKTKLTKPQVEADGCQRTINLKGAFSFNKKKLNLVKDKNFLIIDDVLTTGSTLNECACCLKQAGANKVFALALAGGN